MSILFFKNINSQKYRRARYDSGWLRQLIVAVDSYKTKYGIYPDTINQLIGIDYILKSALISRQGVYRGIEMPHYIYIKPDGVSLKANKPMIYLRPECMEFNQGKIMVGFQDGHIGVEILDINK